MSSSVSQEAILQAILELSHQLKETKTELKEDIQEVKANINRLEDKIDKVDAKFEVLNSSLLSTQADVHRLKKVL